jgi:hypothetical protein
MPTDRKNRKPSSKKSKTPALRGKDAAPDLKIVSVELDGNAFDGVTQESLVAAAEKTSIPIDQLEGIVKYGSEMRRIASEMDLLPHHVLSASVNLTGEILKDCFPAEMQERMCTDVFHQLWEHCGLPKDR